MPQLSIIVPVYNVEAYIEKCLKSILNQTFRDFEVILIDDGSTDRSGIICDEFSIKDSRIIIIHQTNKGVSAARNTGLEIASGKYIGFVDADDWIDSLMYEKMIFIAEENQYDVIICGINYFSHDNHFIRSTNKFKTQWKREELVKDLYNSPSLISGGCCNKLIIRQKVREVRFDTNLHMAEDIVYLIKCFEKIDTGYQTDECYYNVLEREDSSTRCDKIDAMYRIVIQGKKTMMNYALEYSEELGKTAVVKYLDDCIRYSNLIKKEGKTNKLPYIRHFMNLRLETFHKTIHFWVSGKISGKTARRFILESLL